MTIAANAASLGNRNRPVIVLFDSSLGYTPENVTVISAGACAAWECMSISERRRIIARAHPSAHVKQGEGK